MGNVFCKKETQDQVVQQFYDAIDNRDNFTRKVIKHNQYFSRDVVEDTFYKIKKRADDNCMRTQIYYDRFNKEWEIRMVHDRSAEWQQFAARHMSSNRRARPEASTKDCIFPQPMHGKNVV